MTHISEIEPGLRKTAAAAAGYTVVYSGLISGWGYRWHDGVGLNARWGWIDEAQAWDEAFAELCRRETVYRHKKGGIYVSVMGGRSTVDNELVMIYRHLAPHEPGVWVRPLAEFDEPGRFVHVSAG